MKFSKVFFGSRPTLVFIISVLSVLMPATYIRAQTTEQHSIEKQNTEKQTSQVPGYYRYMVGDFVVTALYDGYVNISPDLLKGMGSKEIQTLISRMFQAQGKDGVQTAVNAYLIKTNDSLVLIDTGAAKCFGPTLGNVIDNIRASGYTPEAVDKVLLTHMHPDHMCGLVTADGKAAFPNATVIASQEEKDFWFDPKIIAATSDELRPFFKMAQEAAAPYIAKDAFRTFKGGDNIMPGIDSLPTQGHTPGHSSYILRSEDNGMLVWGDIVHSHSVQFANPEVSIEFDSDNEKAVATRKAIFEQVAQEKWLIGGAHLPFPGMGHVRKETDGYTWVPVEYAPIPTNK